MMEHKTWEIFVETTNSSPTKPYFNLHGMVAGSSFLMRLKAAGKAGARVKASCAVLLFR